MRAFTSGCIAFLCQYFNAHQLDNNHDRLPLSVLRKTIVMGEQGRERKMRGDHGWQGKLNGENQLSKTPDIMIESFMCAARLEFVSQKQSRHKREEGCLINRREKWNISQRVISAWGMNKTCRELCGCQT